MRFLVLAEFFGGFAVLDDLQFLTYPNVPLSVIYY